MYFPFLSISFLLLAPLFTAAMPINSQGSSTSTAGFAVFIALVVLLSFLVFVKYRFMKRRREAIANAVRAPSIFSTASCDSIASADTVWIIKRENMGFFVGLFGSPTWETRNPPQEYKAIWNGRSFVTHHARVSPKKCQPSIPNQSLQNSESPESAKTIIATHNEEKLPARSERWRSHSLHLPSSPIKAINKQGSPKNLRRFSLPSTRSGHSSVAVQSQKKFSSLNGGRSRSSASSASAKASLRLVASSGGSDLPLPLLSSGRLSRSSSRSHPSPPAVNTMTLDDLSYPPLPTQKKTARAQITPVKSQETADPLRISPPYALKRASRRVSQDMATSRNTLKSSLKSATISSTSQELSSMTDYSTSKSSSSPPSLNILNVPVPSPTFSPSALSSYPFPLKRTPPLQSKPKVKFPARLRRSPVAGPSPLRTMILPELSDQTAPKDKENFHSTSPAVGLGLPSSVSFGDSKQHQGTPEPLQTTSSFRNLTTRPRRESRPQFANDNDNSEDPNVILGMIRELIEETSEWDASLFMDDNFKAMVRNSKLIAAASAAPTPVIPDRQSTEIDLGLLGLGDEPPQYGLFGGGKMDGSVHSDKEELRSFWEEDRAEEVGIAR